MVAEAAKAAGVRRVVLVSSAFVSPWQYWSPIRLILNSVKFRLMDAKFEAREQFATRLAARSTFTLPSPRRASKRYGGQARRTPSFAPDAWRTVPAATQRGVWRRATTW